MIPSKSRRGRRVKMSKNIERIYKEGKCRDCSVVVTQMDFARILGKFTKVKIQYESNTSPKAKTKQAKVSTPSPITRLKNNENGMVLLHRNAYSEHPVKNLVNNKTKANQQNILKENNRLKKTPLSKKDKNSNYNGTNSNSNLKRYGIIFENPVALNNNDFKNKATLSEILPSINKNILPSDEWSLNYFPKNYVSKDDKVYNRIAAELEDLMFNEKPEATESKVDEFPSIMDILNDNTSVNKPVQLSKEVKPSLDSNDVEAMLLGKSNEISKELHATGMEVDNPEFNKLLNDVENLDAAAPVRDAPSPSILDEALQTGIEQHLPCPTLKNDAVNKSPDDNESDKNKKQQKANVTHVVFQLIKNGTCYKSVTCPKSLKYSIELEGKSIELLGAPKFVSSLDDLQVLLQIVNESELQSLYVTQ